MLAVIPVKSGLRSYGGLLMAVSSKDIEALWKRYPEKGASQKISVVQFFESNGVPYHVFEK